MNLWLDRSRVRGDPVIQSSINRRLLAVTL
jgi:hypothetical protein